MARNRGFVIKAAVIGLLTAVLIVSALMVVRYRVTHAASGANMSILLPAGTNRTPYTI